MIIRRLADINGTDRDVRDNNWRSQRLLLADDGMGFSFHITTIEANSSIQLHYTNHLESVYCIHGTGTIKDLQTQAIHSITPGTLYALNDHDNHCLTAITELHLACVFNPPCTGKEVHDETGAYPAAATIQTQQARCTN